LLAGCSGLTLLLHRTSISLNRRGHAALGQAILAIHVGI
jgi:hypothetical protein